MILPQTLPGIVIGSIFIFVLTMGEYGTVLVVGQNYVQSVGTIVNSYITNAVQYPQGAAAAVLLVLGADRRACSRSPASRTCARTSDVTSAALDAAGPRRRTGRRTA